MTWAVHQFCPTLDQLVTIPMCMYLVPDPSVHYTLYLSAWRAATKIRKMGMIEFYMREQLEAANSRARKAQAQAKKGLSGDKAVNAIHEKELAEERAEDIKTLYDRAVAYETDWARYRDEHINPRDPVHRYTRSHMVHEFINTVNRTTAIRWCNGNTDMEFMASNPDEFHALDEWLQERAAKLWHGKAFTQERPKVIWYKGAAQ